MLMVSATQKLLGQALFIAAGITCLRLGEHDIGLMLISGAIGSVVPVAEKAVQSRRPPHKE